MSIAADTARFRNFARFTPGDSGLMIAKEILWAQVRRNKSEFKWRGTLPGAKHA